jgi:hypothetical protein
MVDFDIILALLFAQGLLGAADVLWNHEYREGLPNRASARTEQFIHGVRELLYAIVFAGLAWFVWAGAFAWIFAAILLIEIGLTAWDFVVEDQTRKLSPQERVTHLVLSMGGGAYCALLAPYLVAWAKQPTALVFTPHGVWSWLLSACALGVFAWGVRDLASHRRLAAA